MRIKRLILAALFLAALAGTFFFIGRSPSPEKTVPITGTGATGEAEYGAATDFARAGYLTFNSPGDSQDTPYLLYEESGKPGLSARLQMDELSVCAAPNGATPCMAMSVTYSTIFSGKRAIVEGVRGTGSDVTVRKLRVLDEREEPRVPESGDVFIPWTRMREMIESCAARSLLQTHALDVYATDVQGVRVRAVEPVIDEVFRIAQRAQPRCGTTPVATE